MAGVVLLGVVFTMRTREGTLVVEISDPEATLQVLDAQGELLIERKAGAEKVAISVVPGKGKLRVAKNGVELLTREFSLLSGGQETILAKLEPVPLGPTPTPTPASTPTPAPTPTPTPAPTPTPPPTPPPPADEPVAFQGHSGAVFNFVLSPDEKQMVSGGADRLLRVWNIEEQKEVFQLEGHTASARPVAFSADGRRLLSCGQDKTTRLWDLETRREIARLDGTAEVFSAIFVPGEHRC